MSSAAAKPASPTTFSQLWDEMRTEALNLWQSVKNDAKFAQTKIVPVVDLRERFGLGACEDSERICIVVVQVDGAEGASRLTGMIVDVVEEVSHFQIEDLEPPPDFGDAIDARFIVGMAKSKGTVKTVLDIDRLLSHVGQIDLRAINGRSAEA